MKNQINISWKKKRKKKKWFYGESIRAPAVVEIHPAVESFRPGGALSFTGLIPSPKENGKNSRILPKHANRFLPLLLLPLPLHTHTHTHKHKHNVRCCHISQIFIRIEASSARSLKPHLGRLRAFTGRRIQFHRTRAMTNPRRFLHFPPPDPVSTMNKSCIERDSGNSEENHHYKTFPNLKSPKYKYINNNYYNNDNNACPSWLQAIRVG